MTKIAYIRASQLNPSLQFSQTTPTTVANPPKSPMTTAPRVAFFAPPMPGAHPPISFPPASQLATATPTAVNRPPPQPKLMTPTTRFNSNPTVLLPSGDQSGPGGRISKPLMEKRRRARINQCLSQLKQIVVDSAGQYTSVRDQELSRTFEI